MTIPPVIPRAALVTGGAHRLGRAIALALADAGFSVAVHRHGSAADADATAGEIRARGVGACVLVADLADEAAVERLVPDATAALGPLGVLVNNASVFNRDSWQDATRAGWDTHLETNLRAPFVLMQRFADALPAAAEGVVVNMLDQRVWSLTPHFITYTVSKAGLWALTQTMALALAPRIRVNGIGPGPALASTRQSAEEFAREAASVRLGHGTSPDEVARGGACAARHAVGDRADAGAGRRAAFAVESGGQYAGHRGVTAMETQRIADATRGLRHVFLRDLVLSASIGVHAHEHQGPQRIRVNVDLGVLDDGARPLSRVPVGRDQLSRVVDYEALANRVRSIVAAGHVRLVETLAERIAEACLEDGRVELARIRVEKLDVFADAASAGVEVGTPPPLMLSTPRRNVLKLQ